PGASVLIKELSIGVPTNTQGFYSISFPLGTYSVEISSIGYETYKNTISFTGDVTLNVQLKSAVVLGPEVEIVGEKTQNTESTDMGRVDLQIESIKTLPAFLGEVDVLKTIQFLPGVQSAGEGNAGFYVRGGGPDQNLILLDNATVYNASHLFGFFSVFNADAIKGVEIIKGGMPASYGGRVSSVLDISLKEGNAKKTEIEGGIGLISSRLTVQGPIKKDTASFIVSARRTYIDVLLSPFINEESNFSGSSYYFYDLNMKLNYRLSDKDRFFASGYFGRDVFNFQSKTVGFGARIPWGNAIMALRWNHLFSDKLFMNTMASFTDYRFAFEGSQEDFNFALNSGIRDWSGKVHLSYYPDYRHQIQAGAEYIYHTFTPSQATASSGDTEFDLGNEMPLLSHEAAFFIQDQFDISDVLRVNAGLRYSMFLHVGPFTRYQINDEADPLSPVTVPETIEYGQGEKVKYYGGWEPRINARLRLNERAALKAGYTHNYQYIHLASLSQTSLPTDVWLPSTDRVQPQFGKQYNLGYFRDLQGGMYETSVELYYKDMRNLVEYEEGARPENNLNNNADNQLVFGSGTSYGVELFVKKVRGDFNGWIGYTWSKTDRVFLDLNDGNSFPAKFDRRHDLSVVASYNLNDKLTFGATFVYGTGNAITLPVSRYFYEGRVVDVYGERNSFRMAPFHRADLSLTYYPPKTRAAKRGEKSVRFTNHWTFSIYNVYNRQNPYFIYFGNTGNLEEGTLQIKAYQVSLFPILPSATWNFHF
ncbi:MAG: hypothetical protein RL226_1170, partial [Bacteroidota bacterium]